MTCYFHGKVNGPCDGPLMRCHVIPQRVLKREHQRANPRSRPAWHEATPLTGTDLQDLLDDPRNWVVGCHRHHHLVDFGSAFFPPPESARDFAAEYELSHFVPAEEARK